MPHTNVLLHVLISGILLATRCAGTDSAIEGCRYTAYDACPQHGQPLHLSQAPLLLPELSSFPP